jgi:mannose-6-phosphate isomerase
MVSDPKSDIVSAVAALSAWLREAAWPCWLAHGVDRGRGGFYEALDLRTHACTAPFRRLRVVARQIHVFSEAHRAGVAGAAEAVRLGLAFLADHAVHEDGGYAWRFDLHHRPIDLTRDLYDHAFILLALASATEVVGADTLRPQARALLDWLMLAFRHGQGGFLESLPPALPRRQNPHMHLLEALLAAHQAFGDAAYLTRAEELITLFADRLFDRHSGALPEFFDDALYPLRDDGRFVAEPGHHCEWVWLLHEFQAIGGARADLSALSQRLMQFVDRFGIDPVHGGLLDGVQSDGSPTAAGSRLWPQTERLKAEFLRPAPSPARQLHAARVLAAYLRPDGLWHERRDADGVFSDEPAPASSLYHLTGAILAAEACIAG